MIDAEALLADLAGYPDVVPPIHLATTFHGGGPHGYRRAGHPGLADLEVVAAALDGGVAARAFASGMAAIASLFETLDPGSRVLAPAICYHGTRDWLRHLDATGRIDLQLVEAGEWDDAIAAGTDVVWLEPCLNPTLDVLDVSHLATVAGAVGAETWVDATATPLTTRPLELGADVVVHSASKAYNGHSDVHAGLVVTARVGERWDRLERIRSLLGTILQPWDAWLLVRGLRTLPVRVDRTSATAADLAVRLAEHPDVRLVRYPGLPAHPNHDVAVRQMTRGFGALLSIEVADFGTAAAMVDAVAVWTKATSFGGVESLIEHRAAVEPPDSPIAPGLVRLSVGLDPVEDLWADLAAALEAS